MKTQILILTSFFLLTACGKRNEDQSPAPTPVATPELKTELSECRQREAYFQNKVGLHMEPTQKTSIKRVFQRVIRKDCNGQVASDEIETVVKPHSQIELSPEQRLGSKTTGVHIFNPGTCDWRDGVLPQSDPFFFGNLNAITGDAKGEIKLKLDMVDALLTFQVREGNNPIYYTYYKDCTFENGNKEVKRCEESDAIQSGIYSVDVTYSEEVRPGELVVEATGCKDQK